MSNIEEIWKSVKGYEDYYEVSNLGKVRSKDREVVLSGKRKGQVRCYPGRELKPLNSQGHLTVNLQKGGSRLNVGLGRLVAIHFLEGFEDSGRTQVKYKDGDSKNCSITNLE